MKALVTAPNLVDQVRDAIVEAIAAGTFAAGDRIIQEQVAQRLGVSRQPVQQALVLLRTQGVLQDAPGRGLLVAPLDPDRVQHMYELRTAIEGLAARLAAQRGAERAAREGPAVIEAGRQAVAAGSLAGLIAADMAFHAFLHALSGNPMVAPALETHLTYTQRVMGQVLMNDEQPRDIWDQHEAILQAVAAGDADGAEQRARQHLMQACAFMVARLRGAGAASGAASSPRAQGAA